MSWCCGIVVVMCMVLFALRSSAAGGQTGPSDVYHFDASSVSREIRSGLLKMGANQDPKGHEISANSYFFTRDGKPWLPVMGEMHYARYPRVQWEQEILKMKAGGIQIVATHPLWVHHEEIEGQWDWSGDMDLREFVKLCAKHGLYCWVKIGGNGDCRGSGLPDWMLSKTTNLRCNDPVYMKYARRFYEEVCKQCEGLYFKDGGPIIGVQLDNEVQGDEYMLTLKRYAREFGCDVPFYSATGWGMKLPLDEFLLVFGAYPDAPWIPGCHPLGPNTQYLFPSSLFDNSYDYQRATMPENLDKAFWFKTDRCPFTTAEVTGGNQIKYNRRPFFRTEDITAMAYTMLGKGVNLLGYYMYHGGSNPMGKLTSMEEAGYPVISYDFDAPLGEFGRPQEWYHSLRLLHLFMHDFGDLLAPTLPVLPSGQPTAPADADTLRSIVRVKDNSGFLFLNNHHYLVQMKDLGPLQFEVKLKSETLTMPGKPVKIEKNVYAIWPINFSVGGATLKYATAQPICKVHTDNGMHYFFFAPRGIAPEYVFGGATVASVEADGAKVARSNDRVMVSGLEPGAGCVFTVKTVSGETVRISTLTYQQAMRCWKASIWGSERVFLSDDSNLLFDHDRLEIHSTGQENFSFAVYPSVSGSLAAGSANLSAPQKEGVFTRYAVKVPRMEIPVDLKLAFQNKPAPKSHPLSGVNWIWSEKGQYIGFGYVRKKFSIPEGAKVKSAQFFFVVDDTLLLWVNGREVKADPASTPPNDTGGWGHVTRIDISRYLTPGSNLIAGGVSNMGGMGAFAAKCVVEFEDGQSVTFTTNDPWLFAKEEQSGWTSPGFDDSSWRPAAVICPVGSGVWGMPSDAPCWIGATATVSVPPDALDGLNDLFLKIDYVGDTARLYYNGQLIADDLYHGHPAWMVGLRRFAPMIGNSLGRTMNTTFMKRDISLEISPLKKDAPICMPVSSWPKFTGEQIAEIRSVTVVPEYKVVVTQ